MNLLPISSVRSQSATTLLTPYSDVDELRAQLLGSLLLYTQFFYKVLKKRDFDLKLCPPRESYAITMCRELVNLHRLNEGNIIFNLEPRIGKTTLVASFLSWCFAHNPYCEFIYAAYAMSVSVRVVMEVRALMKSYEYQNLFPNALISNSKSLLSKDTQNEFYTQQGGCLYGVGTDGAITSRGMGCFNSKFFSGCGIIDDGLKPEDALSDTIRESRNDWIFRTFLNRRNDPRTPVIIIAQRLHEQDQTGTLLENRDLFPCKHVSLPSIDEKGNFLTPDPEHHKYLLALRENQPYTFYSQYQQTPQPAGGMHFHREEFISLFAEPVIFSTFITADTAETSKKENDATVFSFWGVYRSKELEIPCLHWLDCVEIRIEPKDLREAFMDFYQRCLAFKVKPMRAYIEKASTGTTLISTLKDVQGLQVIDVLRKKNKSTRFKECQEYIASKRITFPRFAPHFELCVKHVEKITFNETHAHDDIMDTLADAIDIALIKCISYTDTRQNKEAKLANTIRKLGI